MFESIQLLVYLKTLSRFTNQVCIIVIPGVLKPSRLDQKVVVGLQVLCPRQQRLVTAHGSLGRRLEQHVCHVVRRGLDNTTTDAPAEWRPLLSSPPTAVHEVVTQKLLVFIVVSRDLEGEVGGVLEKKQVRD